MTNFKELGSELPLIINVYFEYFFQLDIFFLHLLSFMYFLFIHLSLPVNSCSLLFSFLGWTVYLKSGISVVKTD